MFVIHFFYFNVSNNNLLSLFLQKIFIFRTHTSCHRKKVFCKKKFFKKFCKFHKITPVLEFLFNKIAGLQTCNFIKNRLQYRCFTVKFAKFFKSTYFEEHPRTAASKNRDSFLEVFCRSCCSALINTVMKYSSSAAVVKGWRFFMQIY